MSTGVAKATERDVHAPDGRVLRVYETGDPDGELILSHHGTPCCGILASWWADDAAARGIRLVGYDRPGYGGSDRHAGRSVADVAADAAAIADALGADRFRTWGLSGGGPHALACAALLPDRIIAAASLAGVGPYDADGLEWSAGMGQDNLDEFGAAAQGEEALREYLATAREQALAMGVGGLAEEWRSLLPDVDVAVLTGEMAEFAHAYITSGLGDGYEGWLDDDLAFVRREGGWGFDPAAISVPVLIVQGGRDLMVPPSHGEWLAGRVPGAQAWLSPDQGHLTLFMGVGMVHGWLLTAGS